MFDRVHYKMCQRLSVLQILSKRGEYQGPLGYQKMEKRKARRLRDLLRDRLLPNLEQLRGY